MRSDKHLRIAIDGESASGKSYASKIIGKKYKCYVLNSGLAYRYASYLVIKNKPSFHPYRIPIRRTIKVCIVIGTGQKGIFIFADKVNKIVPKTARNKFFNKDTSFKFLISSINRFLLLFLEKSTYLLPVKKYPLNHHHQ